MWRAALKYSALGLEMGVAVIIGYGLGWWLDRKFGTKPYLTIVFLLFGIAAGFRGLIRAAREVAASDSGAGDDGEDQK